MKNASHRNSGQALIEYLFIFTFIALILVLFVRGINIAVTETMGGLAYALSVQLSVGVCETECFFNGFNN